LKRIDIPFEVEVDSDLDAIDFASKNGVSIFFKAAGEANENSKPSRRLTPVC
jgi:hypothetical protein